MDEGKDRTNPVTTFLVLQAKERLIQRRETHLDQLADKLKEERVRGVIEPILTGETFEQDFRPDDVGYLLDLGLIVQLPNGELSIANPIYQEVIPRELSWSAQTGMALKPYRYISPDGHLLLSDMLGAFVQFFREHSGSWIEIAQYKEAAPQLLLMAFLQRIINGGGHIHREYGLGRMRTDLFILWNLPDGAYQRFIIECKILHYSRERTIREGLEQIWQYADSCAADEAHLVIFDRDPSRSWDEKIFCTPYMYEGTDDRPIRYPVTVWGI